MVTAAPGASGAGSATRAMVCAPAGVSSRVEGRGRAVDARVRHRHGRGREPARVEPVVAHVGERAQARRQVVGVEPEREVDERVRRPVDDPQPRVPGDARRARIERHVERQIGLGLGGARGAGREEQDQRHAEANRPAPPARLQHGNPGRVPVPSRDDSARRSRAPSTRSDLFRVRSPPRPRRRARRSPSRRRRHRWPARARSRRPACARRRRSASSPRP